MPIEKLFEAISAEYAARLHCDKEILFDLCLEIAIQVLERVKK